MNGMAGVWTVLSVMAAVGSQAVIPPFPADPASTMPFWRRVADTRGELAAQATEDALRERLDAFPRELGAAGAPARQRSIERVLTEAERAHQRWPTYPGLVLLMAQLATDAGQWQRASELWEGLERDHLDLVSSFDGLSHAETLAELGRVDEALDLLERQPAPQTGQLEPAFELLRGAWLLQAGRAGEAAQIYERARGTEPVVLLCLAMAYDRSGQHARARALVPALAGINVAIDLVPRVGALLAVQPQRRRRETIAFTSIADWRYALAILAEAQGRRAAAAEDWRAYLATAAPRYARRARAQLTALAREASPARKGRR
jgi:hypothetical protein